VALRPVDRLEPLLPVPKGLDVRAPAHELLKRLELLPHGHVDGHSLIVKRSDGHGVALFRLESPHKTWTAIGERVDHIQLRPESIHDSVFERGPNASDVDLRQMETGH